MCIPFGILTSTPKFRVRSLSKATSCRLVLSTSIKLNTVVPSRVTCLPLALFHLHRPCTSNVTHVILILAVGIVPHYSRNIILVRVYSILSWHEDDYSFDFLNYIFIFIAFKLSGAPVLRVLNNWQIQVCICLANTIYKSDTIQRLDVI